MFWTRFSYVALFALDLLGSQAWAGGFLIYEHGAPATGMADARTASADDLSALYFNPAAITELPGLQIELGATGILPSVSYRAKKPNPYRTYTSYQNGQPFQAEVLEDGTHNTDATVKGFSPIHLYLAYRFGETGVSIGYGLNNPFGLGTYWPKDWDGRFITTESEMQTFFHQPVVALDIAKWIGIKDRFKLSIAAGYNLVHGSLWMANAIDLRVFEQLSGGAFVNPAGEIRLLGNAIGHGWNVALYAELPELLAFGASLRSKVNMPFDFTAKFRFNPAGEQANRMFAQIPEEADGRVTIPMPMQFNAGVAFLGLPSWKFAFDVFGAFFSSYDKLSVRFDCQDTTCTSLKQDPMIKNYQNSWQFSLGAEHTLPISLSLRAGLALSISPAPENTFAPDMVDGLQKMITVGACYRSTWWKVDLGYMMDFYQTQKNNEVGGSDVLGNPNGKANGTYSAFIHLLALSWSIML